MKSFGLTASLVGALALASVAQAAPATGVAEIRIGGQSKVGKALDAAGVRVSAGQPATGGRRGQAIELPVRALQVGPPVSAATTGAIVLRAGKRTLRLQGLELVSSGGASKIAGSVGARDLTLFGADGALTQGGSAAAPKLVLEGARLELTRRAARAISRKLRIERLPGGGTGRLSIDIDLAAATPEPPVDPVDPADPPGGETYTYSAQCPVAQGTVTNSPQDAADPAAAPRLDLPQGVASSSAIEWGFLASFRNYVINAPTAGNVQALDGATPSGADLAAPGAFVGYSAADGEYEAGNELDRSDDRLVASATGTTLFCKPGHLFNVAMKNPAVILDGAQSRLTMDVGANYGGTWHPFQRVDLATLDLSGVTPAPSAGGTVVTWEAIPATMTADGAKALGLPNYPAGTALDPVTVRSTLERPFAEQCTLPADGGSTPTVDFTLAALPALTGAVPADGQLNWGFRGSLRGSVNATGSFGLFAGATRSDPASMAGPGKSFGFPFETASYEEGTPADPADDRLVARSNATVVFCNPNAGSYGVAISRPTVVLDGANSRLTANVHSFCSETWGGGRVDLVSLGDVHPTYDPVAGTVTWSGITVTANRSWQALALAYASEPSTSGYDPVSITIDTTP